VVLLEAASRCYTWAQTLQPGHSASDALNMPWPPAPRSRQQALASVSQATASRRPCTLSYCGQKHAYRIYYTARLDLDLQIGPGKPVLP